MAVELEIKDGDPWWMSNDIWVVPGADPEGTLGTPIVGMPAFLWARVRNNGTTPVQNATVRFYWADPSTGFDRNTANLVGTSFVSLDPGQSSETLCLQPWTPEFVNNGHECVLAEAFHPSSDPLPAAPDFNVPIDRHVAQRNLSVVQAMKSGLFRYRFNVQNNQRVDRKFRLKAEIGTSKQLKPIIATLGIDDKVVELGGSLKKAALVRDPCAGEDAAKDPAIVMKGVDVEVAGNRKHDFTLVGVVKGGPVLLHIVQCSDDHVVGGTAVLVVAHDKKRKGR